MSATKLVTVFGATGNQGGSVVSAILSHPELKSKYAIRAVTRDTTKESAKALASRGCEVVAANLDDAATVRRAVEGSYAVFGVTNYWEKEEKEIEVRQGRNIADAAFAAGVRHLVWSSLPHATDLTGGKLPGIPHFDSKAEVERYIEAHKAKSGTAGTYYMPGYFMANVKMSIQPSPQDGVPTFAAMFSGRETRLAMVDAGADTGKYVAGILEAGPEASDGAQVHGVSEWMSPQELVDQLSEVIGQKVNYAQIPRDMFKSFLPPSMAEEMAQNSELIVDYSYYGKGEEEKQAQSDRFLLQGTKTTSWKEYVEANGPWKW